MFGFDALFGALHLNVLLLAHDSELVVLELGLGVESEELLLRIFRVELDKDATFPGTIIFATHADLNSAVGTEELLKSNLTGFLLRTEALGIHAGCHIVGRGLLQTVEQVFGGGGLLAVAILGRDDNWLLTLDGLASRLAKLAVVNNDQVLAVTKSCYNGAVRLEAAHAREAADVVDRNWVVLGTSSFHEHVVVDCKVGGGEVELDLW